MTKDTIFLMLSTDRYTIQYELYEYVEKNETKKWNCLGNLGNTKYNVVFPPVIEPIDNGKFIFSGRKMSPEKMSHIEYQCFDHHIEDQSLNWSFVPIEIWEKNKTFTRSHLELPLNFSNQTRSLWMLQI